MVRDAAARLPDGVGTRADICTLLRCSQYLEKKSLDSQINNVVSGALDRLHYETDPCVKYDSEKRLWIYLHKNRKVNDPLWNALMPQDTPNTIENNSYKPEYFFENNLPAYESEEEVNMIRDKGNDREEIKERDARSDMYESINSADRIQIPTHYKQHNFESSDFMNYDKGGYKKPKLQ